MTGLGLVGFVDDYIKIFKQRSLGLRRRRQADRPVGGRDRVRGPGAAVPRTTGYRRPASTQISFIRDTRRPGLRRAGHRPAAVRRLGPPDDRRGWRNGVNLTDGLDGLATGTSVMVLRRVRPDRHLAVQPELPASTPPLKCYEVRDPLDLAVVAAAMMGACFGFLWWNASPAKIFMGDTGSLALGGALAGLAITTRTELLLLLLGGLFVLITVSVIIQVGSFKLTGRRVFRMAPLQHHFELAGWGEVTIVIRFWIIAGLFVALGLGVFYAEWVVGS